MFGKMQRRNAFSTACLAIAQPRQFKYRKKILRHSYENIYDELELRAYLV